jgi:hypothetical protein
MYSKGTLFLFVIVLTYLNWTIKPTNLSMSNTSKQLIVEDIQSIQCLDVLYKI